ncbi:thiol:disulfide interchange protein DsbG [Pseudomonas chlororaphis]|uniref:thiol:disulfide interchange protein DsbG n=1 Tax=Pseudomonas TaxID=286 RepID=UPI0008AE01EB|nr:MULTISPECIES: thiol:disulfide interchange protein DsbG [Pseudomonas]AZD17062.1 Thiol:disulfide interchange protein DsbG precursor [Pseudomonas chlororaphis]PXX51866.1 thiol:disulfide interchange protein DsbG [Pseudomonas sp. LAMO17WK12:I9]WDH45653.1 thiol:disulfide interchange protein DsbG [Pseudomonas chlororaphis]WDH57500.1 thiol:disulfide interchange protein DsbG [Pseudomonas chlororaphis]WQE16757.1 thiol:disulfide interchange protein DsbG [Pseudomonas chlororaphis]
MPFIRHLLSLSLGAALLQAPLLHAEELPEAVKKIEAKGAKIVGSFDAPDGLKGYAAQYQNRGMALYLTPDGKHVLLGNLYDADGKDLSAEPLQKLVYAPMAKAVWAKMEKSHWIADGKADAPRVVYLFSDPNCPYCNMFWEQARPWVNAGKVQLRHIMVGIIREDSPGKSAALLAAKDPQKALQDHEKAGKGSSLKPLAKIPAEVQAKLDANMALMDELELSATPAIFYMDDKGELQQQQGAPAPDKLGKIFGPK